MVTIDLIDELQSSLNRQGMGHTELSELIHVSKQAVSNWFKRDAIPLDKMIVIANALNDERFKFVVADHILNIRLLVKNEYKSDPLSQLMRVIKEENERNLLNEQLQTILAIPPLNWNIEQKNFVRKFQKEFHEERQAENDLAILLDVALEVR